MKNQKGFTLVELMVVLVIIGILSVGGITQYGKFIKGARDSARMTDIEALNTVMLSSIEKTGLVPEDVSSLAKEIYQVTGKNIVDPLDGKSACLEENGSDSAECHYKYAVCDGGTGYIIATLFESKGNVGKYKKDDVSSSNASDVLSDNLYERGNCETVNYGPENIISAEATLR